MDSVYSSTIFDFAKVGGLDDDFTEVVPHSYRGILGPSKDERICDKYGDYDITFYEYTFCVGICLPFIAFEIGVIKHLIMDFSQIHPTSWEYMKVYQYWCEYLNKEPFVILFFHIFKCHRD